MRYTSGIPGNAALVVLVVLGLLLSSAYSYSQQNDAKQGRQQGWVDGRGDVKWLTCGILLPGVSLILPWVLPVSVPPDDLLGRSADFIDAYLKSFAGRTKLGSFLWSAAGTTIDVVVVGGCILMVEAAQACMGLPEQAAGCLINFGLEGCASSGCMMPDLSGCSGLGLFREVEHALSEIP